MPRRLPDPDKIASILVDAELLGDAACCKRHRISRRTLSNYRQRRKAQGAEGQLARLCEQKTALVTPTVKAVLASLAEVVRETRLELLSRMKALAATSDDLKAVAGAYKLVTDAQLAERVVLPDGQRDEPAGLAGQGGEAPQAPVRSLQ